MSPNKALKNRLRKCAYILKECYNASYILNFDVVRDCLTDLNSTLPNEHSTYIKEASAPFIFDKETEPYFRYHVKKAFDHLKQAYVLLKESEDYPRDTFNEWLDQVEPELGKGLEKAASKFEKNKTSAIKPVKLAAYNRYAKRDTSLVVTRDFRTVKEAATYIKRMWPEAKLIDFKHDQTGFKQAFRVGSKTITLREDYLEPNLITKVALDLTLPVTFISQLNDLLPDDLAKAYVKELLKHGSLLARNLIGLYKITKGKRKVKELVKEVYGKDPVIILRKLDSVKEVDAFIKDLQARLNKKQDFSKSLETVKASRKLADSVEEPCEIKVTRIKDRFHVRCFVNGRLYSEMSSDERQDIGYLSKEQLRWVSKMGIDSPMAEASRARNKNWTFVGDIQNHKRPG